MKKLILFVALLTSSITLSSEIEVFGKKMMNSCGYYSFSTFEVNVTYKNLYVRWGERVFFEYGYTYREVLTNEVEMNAISDYKWVADLHYIYHERSSNFNWSRYPLVFRFKIVDQHGQVRYENPNNQKYFRAKYNDLPLFRDCDHDDHMTKIYDTKL